MEIAVEAAECVRLAVESQIATAARVLQLACLMVKPTPSLLGFVFLPIALIACGSDSPKAEDLVPGKRVLIQNLYPPTLGVASSAKRGSKIVVFSAGWETFGKEDYHISNIDRWTTDLESKLVQAYQALVPPSPVP